MTLLTSYDSFLWLCQDLYYTSIYNMVVINKIFLRIIVMHSNDINHATIAMLSVARVHES